MAIVALLFGPAEPSLITFAVAGVELTERQVRQVRHAGATRIFVIGGCRNYGPDAVNLGTAAMLGPRLRDGNSVLVLAAGLVADDRIIDAVYGCAVRPSGEIAPIVATWPAASAQRGVERIDALTCAAGVAVYPAGLVRRIALELGDWELHSTLLRAGLGQTGCVRVDLATLPVAATEASTDSLTYALVATSEAASVATAAVLQATARARSDATGRYIYPVIQRALLQLLAPTRITPRIATAFAGVIGIAAAASFAAGWLWTGLMLALLFGPLQNIGERLAGARVIRLRWHRWTMFTAAVGYAWWLALAVTLTLSRGNGGPLAVAALLLLAQITAASEARAVRPRPADHRGPASRTDRRIALFTANRDSLALLMVPFALAGVWYAGLIAMAAYSVASFAVTHARFLQRWQFKPA